MTGADYRQVRATEAHALKLGMTLDVTYSQFSLKRGEEIVGLFSTLDRVVYYLYGYDEGIRTIKPIQTSS